MQRDATSSSFPIGSTLPEFELPSVGGGMVGSQYLKGAKAAMVIFSCNHCPYVKGSEQRIIDIVRAFEPKGLRTVVINSNDALQYPEDSFEKMKEKALQWKLPYPYLYDESQQVAALFDAECTPEIYVFNSESKLAFHGTVNDNPRNREQAKVEYLTRAIEQILAGHPADPSFVHPVGCSIKWKLGVASR